MNTSGVIQKNKVSIYKKGIISNATFQRRVTRMKWRTYREVLSLDGQRAFAFILTKKKHP